MTRSGRFDERMAALTVRFDDVLIVVATVANVCSSLVERAIASEP
jgi:hypothetical protein